MFKTILKFKLFAFVAMCILKMKNRIDFSFFFKTSRSFRKNVKLSVLAAFQMKATKICRKRKIITN